MTGADREVVDVADVVILGAGPAGLATAWYAARRGLRVVVVERGARVGGLAATIVVDGCPVDLGSHRLHPSLRADLLEDLRGPLGVDLVWRPRHGRIRLHDRWLAFPLRPADLAVHARPSFTARVAFDAVAAPIRRRHAARSGRADSFAERVRAGLGQAVAEEFYEPYARKLFGIPAGDLSAELFRRRVSAGTPSAMLRRLARRGPPPGFWYPSGGFGEICDALARGVVELGGAVVTGAAVERIEGGDSPAVSLAGDHKGDHRGDRWIAARTIVSTIPPRSLVRALDAPRDVVHAADSLALRGAVLVYLSVPAPRYTSTDAHYFPGPESTMARLSEPKNYRGGPPVSPPTHSVLCAEIPATPGDDVWESADGTLAARVRADLVAMGLPDPSPRAVHVERRRDVYPVYRIGHDRHQDVVDRFVAGIENLAVLGRHALFAHDNTHHALLMGSTLASSLRDDGCLDRRAWETARGAFADHVVED